MKSKLLAICALCALSVPMIAVTKMCVKRSNGDIVKISVQDVEKVYYEILNDTTATPLPNDTSSVVPLPNDTSSVVPLPNDTSVVPLPNDTSSVTPLPNDTAVVDTNVVKLEYSYNDKDKTVWVTGGCASSVVIPENVSANGNTYKVVGIQSEAFSACMEMEVLQIPESVTKIDSFAFISCSGLTEVKLPSNLESIEQMAFYSCKNLLRITIPSSVKRIGDFAFANCEYLQVYIDNEKDSVEIGYNAFLGCGSVSYKQTGSSLVQLHYDFLPNNTAVLTKGCLHSVVIPDSIRYITGNVPIAAIGDSAFYNCDSMASIQIPFGIKSIGSMAFYGCDNLTEVFVSSSVTSIGDLAFSECNNLDVVVDNSEDSITLGANPFLNCSSVTFKKDVNIPVAQNLPFKFTATSDSTVEISGCTKDSIYGTVVIPENVRVDGNRYTVTSIGNSVFESCNRLTNIQIPESVTKIGNSVFANCNGLTKIEIPSSIVSIGDEAFIDCANMMSVTIPSSVKNIGAQAFAYCSKLSIVIDNTEDNVKVGSNAFFDCKSVKFKE